MDPEFKVLRSLVGNSGSSITLRTDAQCESIASLLDGEVYVVSTRDLGNAQAYSSIAWRVFPDGSAQLPTWFHGTSEGYPPAAEPSGQFVTRSPW